MLLTTIDAISFGDDDANLFLVDDLFLKANALKNSLLPRLQALIQHCAIQINKVYGIDVFQNSIISKYPNFRNQRVNDFDIDYMQAFAGIGGQRADKWNGFSNKNGKSITVLPFRLGFIATENGIQLLLENGWLKNINKNSFDKLLKFHFNHQEKITSLLLLSGMQLDYFDNQNPLLTISEHLSFIKNNDIIDMSFMGQNIHYPIQENTIYTLIRNFVIFYPIYDSYIQIAKGNNIRFNGLLEKLNQWLMTDNGIQTSCQKPIINQTVLIQNAEQHFKVMPSIRWRVFQRDNWKCVSCGRTAHDDVILHIDHIIPRSLGGTDTYENYQTLCHICNIGKSNKDDTDLRNQVG